MTDVRDRISALSDRQLNRIIGSSFGKYSAIELEAAIDELQKRAGPREQRVSIPEDVLLADLERERPWLVTVLCILNFGIGGLSILFSLLALIAWLFPTLVMPVPMPGLFRDAVAMMHLDIRSALEFACTLAIVAGVVLMWNMNRLGFYLYSLTSIFWATLSALGHVLMPGAVTRTILIFGIRLETPWVELAGTIPFIVLFGLNRHAMSVPEKPARRLVPVAAAAFGGASILAALAFVSVGQISGVLHFKGAVDRYQTVRFGCDGPISNSTMYVRQMQVNAGYLSDTLAAPFPEHMRELMPFDAQTRVFRDQATGLNFQFGGVSAGRYLIYARYADTYVDWHIVDVATGVSRVQTSLTVDLEQAGSVSFERSSGTGKVALSLTPLDDRDREGPGIDVSLEEETATISPLKPGTYEVSAWGRDPVLRHRVWKVAVAAGKPTQVRYPPADEH